VAALLAPADAGVRGGAAGAAGRSARSPHAPAGRPHAEGADPVVCLEGVGFSYAGTGDGVSGVDMRVYPGELVGVIGQNGAGKTTLTKLLNGLLRPAEGRVLMAGMDTRTTPISTLAREVSTLFQNPDRQLCKNTVIDEVAFGPELHGVAREEALARAGRVVERFGLPADESPFVLSRGQRQMVALASVVVMDPRVVLLDEPTAGLDYRECMTVMDTVRELAERGCAVVMVCHDMEVVSDFAERVLVMADGRVVGRGPTEEVFAQDDLLARASLRAPEVARLSAALAADVDVRLGGRTQVGDLVDAIGEMVRNG
jgi:energy-coupling factor transporter ATP-binding protein EcfA2